MLGEDGLPLGLGHALFEEGLEDADVLHEVGNVDLAPHLAEPVMEETLTTALLEAAALETGRAKSLQVEEQQAA